MKVLKNLGNNLKEARKYMGFTQREMASLLFMSKTQYNKFENEIFQFNGEQILKICEILEITPNKLFDVEN